MEVSNLPKYELILLKRKEQLIVFFLLIGTFNGNKFKASKIILVILTNTIQRHG